MALSLQCFVSLSLCSYMPHRYAQHILLQPSVFCSSNGLWCIYPAGPLTVGQVLVRLVLSGTKLHISKPIPIYIQAIGWVGGVHPSYSWLSLLSLLQKQTALLKGKKYSIFLICYKNAIWYDLFLLSIYFKLVMEWNVPTAAVSQ